MIRITPLSSYPRVLTVLSLTAIACNGGTSTTVTVTSVAAGDDCANGGIQVVVTEDDEQQSSDIICNGESGEVGDDGVATLVDTTILERGDENCIRGGVQIDVGADDGSNGGTAGDGVLQSGEITSTEYVCDGAPAFDMSQLDPPAALATQPQYTIELSGGDGQFYGGDGGEAYLTTYDYNNGSGYALDGGHIKLFATGDVDASLTAPSLTTYLGSNPLMVTAHTNVPLLADDNNDGIPDSAPALNSPYMLDNSAYPGMYHLYTWNGTRSVEVTGVNIAASVTLTLPINYEDNCWTGYTYIDCVDVRLGDVVNAGTITVVADNGVRGMYLNTSVYRGMPGSKIDVSGDAASDGGYLALYGQAVHNEGSINGDAGAGAGYYGGYVRLSSNTSLYNTGDISAKGSTPASAGSGGFGGEARLTAYGGSLFNSGTIDASGGDGNASNGGQGGRVRLYTSRGALHNTGTIIASGGDTGNSCSKGCWGGNAYNYDDNSQYAVYFGAEGGMIKNSGDITANGGDGQEIGYGGAAGDIHVRTETGSDPAGSIHVSGDITSTGGDGYYGGEGGHFTAYARAEGIGFGEIALFGYGKVVANGGDAVDYEAGRGGRLRLEQSCPDHDAVALGGVANFVDLEANGGDSTNYYGGQGGRFYAYTCTSNYYGIDVGGSVALNEGDIEVLGGKSTTTRPGRGGQVRMRSKNWTENNGDFSLLGGATDGAEGGEAGYVNFYAYGGTATNTGDIDLSGMASTSATSDGGEAGYIRMEAKHVDNSGDISLHGADSGSTSGDGGEGGRVQLTSSVDASVNTGSFTIAGGTGVTIDGVDGQVIIDGSNESDDWLP